MSGSILSLLSNSDNRDVYGYRSRLPSERSYKEYKNQSNYERQHFGQNFENTQDPFMEFSRDLQRPYQAGSLKITANYELARSIKKSPSETFVISSNPMTKTTASLDRDPSSSPKIVGVERKKNIRYQPVYMQRHSIAFGDDMPNLVDLHYQNYQRTKLLNQSKRSSIAVAAETPPNAIVKPQETTRTGSVKDRISFFNKLATGSSPKSEPVEPKTKPKETFISLLRQKEPIESKSSVIRLSHLIKKMTVRRNSPSASPEAAKSCTHLYKFSTQSLPTPLKRKPSLDKTKIVASSISKGSISYGYGTNPKRHNLMDDLTLVVPVKLRIAEFEKRIQA